MWLVRKLVKNRWARLSDWFKEIIFLSKKKNALKKCPFFRGQFSKL